MPAVACLNRRELEDYSLGRLAGAAQHEAEAHVASCPGCGDALAAADAASDTLLRSLHAPPEDEGSSPGGEYHRAATIVKRLAAVPPGDSSAGFRTDDSALPASPSRPEGELAAAGAAELTRLRDYRLLRKLGEGGMGTVYKALHVRLDRVFALKVLPPDRMHDTAAVARFEREMRAAGRFDHPAIVRATDAGELDGTHFLVMEYVEGLDLARLVERTGPLPIADACEIIRQAAVGLGHVHQQGMVHRDVKPSNLMLATKVEGSGLRVEGAELSAAAHSQPSTINSQPFVNPPPSVKILDLGLALLGGTHGTACELTTVGQFMGTLDYMAPEQADDSHDVDARADIYSLGATLYRLLTGQAPFAGPARVSPVKKFKAVLLSPPPDVSERRPDVPPELAGLIVRMLAKNPGDRPHTAADVARSLEDFSRGADLAALLARAERHAPRETDGGVGGPLPPISSGGGSSHGDQRPDEQPSVRPAASRRKPVVRAAVAALAVLLLAAVYVIRVQTDNGELIIRSADPNVQVLVKRGGEPVNDWQLEQGENRTTVRSGQYEIVLLGNTDGLTIRDGEFTLTRGGEHVVTVERDPAKRLDSATARGDAAIAPGDGSATPQFRAQIKFTSPAEAILNPARDATGSLIIPVRVPVEPGQTWYGYLSNIPDYDAAELSVAIELPPVAVENRSYYESMAIPVDITQEEIERAIAGHLVIRVFYVTEDAASVSSRTLPGIGSPVALDGTIALAVMRLGNRAQIEEHAGLAGSHAAIGDSRNESDAARYGGVTYEEAKRTLQIERKPELVAQAVAVIGALADQGGHAEVVRLLLDTGRHLGAPPRYPHRSEQGTAQEYIVGTLRRLNSSEAAKALSEALENGTQTDRLYALEALRGFSKEEAAVAMPALLATSRDQDSSIRVDAIVLLGHTGLDEPQVIERLQSALRDEDLRVVEYAAKALLELKPIRPEIDAAIDTALLRLLEGDVADSRVLDRKAYAAELLARRKPDAEALVPNLMALLRYAKRDEPRFDAYQTLRSLGPKAAQAVPDLIELAKSKDGPLNWMAIDLLGTVGPEASEALPFLRGIRGGALEDRVAATIRKITGSAVDEDATDNPATPEPSYGGKTYAQAKHLLQSERKPEVVAEAIEAVGALADQASHAEALQLILDAAKHHGDPWIYGGPGSGEVRLKVVTTLQSHFDSTAGVEAISKALSERQSDVRPYLLMALGRSSMGPGDTISPEHARHAVPGLLDATRDEDPRIAGMAMTLAGELAPENTRVRDVLREALSAKHPDVAWAAAYTLADVDPQAEGLIPALRQVIQQSKRPDWQRATAAEFLVRIEPDTEELVAALIELASQKAAVSTDTRGRALVALSKLGARAAPAVSVLIEIVRDDDSGHAYYPAPSFGQLGGGGSIVRPGVSQPEVSKNHRVWAIEALGNIGPAAKDAVPVLESINYTDSIEPAREAIRKITAPDATPKDAIEPASPDADPAPGNTGSQPDSASATLPPATETRSTAERL